MKYIFINLNFAYHSRQIDLRVKLFLYSYLLRQNNIRSKWFYICICHYNRCVFETIYAQKKKRASNTLQVCGGGNQIWTGGQGFADLCLTTWLCRQKSGAENEIRTRDPRLGKAMLYHWAISAHGAQSRDRTSHT